MSTSICLPSIGRLGRSRSALSHESQISKYAPLCYVFQPVSNHHPSDRPHSTSIHILDDDSLIIIFRLCRPIFLDKDEDDSTRTIHREEWDRERWWYKLVKVCRRWRYLILGSATHLHLRLICAYGTPVVEMLAHSPPLPLIIDHLDKDRDITTEDEEGIMLALQRRDRVCRIRIEMPHSNLQGLIMALSDEFPMLEYLYIVSPPPHSTSLILDNTFRAPQLRHLIMRNFALTIGSPLLMTTVGLVTLSLQKISMSAYFHPNDLLQRLSFMPQLEILTTTFSFPFPHDVAGQPSDTSIMTHVTLPNLRGFRFGGSSTYLEVVLSWITAPLLRRLEIAFSNELNFSVPTLANFVSKSENLRPIYAGLWIYNGGVFILADPHKGARVYALLIHVSCMHLNWLVAFAMQITNSLSPVFSTAERLALANQPHGSLPEGHYKVDRTQWCTILRSFRNVKILCLGNEVVGELSRSLQLDDGELTQELLPELKELSYIASWDTRDSFTSFIDARRIAGRPVKLIRR